jgi:hypothetical protein
LQIPLTQPSNIPGPALRAQIKRWIVIGVGHHFGSATMTIAITARRRCAGNTYGRAGLVFGALPAPSSVSRLMASDLTGDCLRLASKTLCARTISINASSARSRRCI